MEGVRKRRRAERASVPRPPPVPSLSQVTLSASPPHTVTDDPYPVFTVDFNTRLAALDPLALFSLAGDGGHDVAYDPDRGRLFVGAAVPDPAVAADLVLTVRDGAVADGAGRPSAGASLTLRYRPGPRPAAAAGAMLANGAWGVAAAAAAGAGAAAGALAPRARAGAAGAALPGLCHWAQRAAWTASLAIPALPRAVRDIGASLAWSTGAAASPFDAAVRARAARGAAVLPPAGGRPFAPALLRVSSAGRLLDASRLPTNMSDARGAAGLPLPALPSVGTTAAGVGPVPDPRPGGAPAPPPPPPPPPPPTALRAGRGGKPPPEPPRAPAPAPADGDDAPAPAPDAPAPASRRRLHQLTRGGAFGGADQVGGARPTPLPRAVAADAGPPVRQGLLGRLTGLNLPPLSLDTLATAAGTAAGTAVGLQAAADGREAESQRAPTPAPAAAVPLTASAAATAQKPPSVPVPPRRDEDSKRPAPRAPRAGTPSPPPPGGAPPPPPSTPLLAPPPPPPATLAIASTPSDRAAASAALAQGGATLVVTSVRRSATSPPPLDALAALALAKALRAAGTDAVRPWLTASRILFWSGVALAACSCARGGAALAARHARARAPAWSAAPRLELTAGLVIVPAWAAAGAGLLGVGGAGVGAGAGLLAASAAALAAAAAVVAAAIAGRGPVPPRAAYVLTQAAAAAAAAGDDLEPAPRSRLDRASRFLLGPPAPPGDWADPAAPRRDFPARAGPLFDAAAGPPCVRRGATFLADASGSVDRGWLAPAPGAALGDGAPAAVRARRAAAAARAGGVLLGALRAAAVGVAVSAPPRLGAAQAGELLAVALLTVAYLRGLRPFRLREDAGAEAAGAAADTVTAVAALGLACAGPDPSSAAVAAVATTILLAQAAALAATVTARGRLSLAVLRGAAWPRGPPLSKKGAAPGQRVANAANTLLRIVRSDPDWLARKYYSRWVAAVAAAKAGEGSPWWRPRGARLSPRRPSPVLTARLRPLGLPPLPLPSPRDGDDGGPAAALGTPGREGGVDAAGGGSPDALLPPGAAPANTPSKERRRRVGAAPGDRLKRAGDRVKAAVGALGARRAGRKRGNDAE